MVPRLATAGASFEGAFLYYCHDKKSRTSARVAWTETVNMMTSCCEKAWKVMAYTSKVATRLKRAAGKKRAGDKVEKPVISYSLSWHPEQRPDKQTMLDAARESIAKLGLGEHEAMIVAHRDEPQPHVHIIINRIHPLTGMAANLYRSKRKLQSWAREFQRKEGTMYCPKREENHAKRQQGEKTRYGNPAIIGSWQQSNDGQGFIEALNENGYDLARGRKRLVVVDPYGKTVNPVRELPDVKAAEFNARLDDIDPQDLPTPEEVIENRSQQSPQTDTPNNKEEPSGIDADFEKRLQAHDDRVFDAITRQGKEYHKEWLEAKQNSRNEIENKRSKLIEHYKIGQRQDAIDGLQNKLDTPGIVPKFVRRFFGMDRKVREKIDRLQITQEKAKTRLDEAMRTMTKTRKQMLQNLEARQSKEQRDLANNLEKWRPRKREQTPEQPTLDRSLSIDWHTDSPGLAR